MSLSAPSRSLLPEAWLAEVSESLGSPSPEADPGLTVEHQWHDRNGGVEFHHQRYDSEDVLREWKPGRVEHPDLRVAGECPSADDFRGGRFHLPTATYVLSDCVQRDLLGLPVEPWKYSEFDLDGVYCRGWICGAGPDGYFQRELRLENSQIFSREASGSIRVSTSGEARTNTSQHDFRINAPYGALLRWLHSDTILGHLMQAGFDVRGDLWRLSTIDGVMDGTRSSYACDAKDVSVLYRYGCARHHPSNLQLLERFRVRL